MFDHSGLVGGMMTGTATTDESANSLKKFNLIKKPAKPGPAKKFLGLFLCAGLG